jgi:hypothetical protein
LDKQFHAGDVRVQGTREFATNNGAANDAPMLSDGFLTFKDLTMPALARHLRCLAKKQLLVDALPDARFDANPTSIEVTVGLTAISRSLSAD